MRLFVIVMAVGSKDFYMDFRLEDTIDKSVPLRNLSAPTFFWFPFQWLRVPQTCLGMFVEFTNKLYSLSVDFGFMAQQFFQVLICLSRYFHLISHCSPRMYLSNSSTLSKETYSPRCTCFSARSNFAKYSSLVIKVGSSFSFTSFLAYRVRRLISGSLSAIAPMLCQSSVFIVFNCTAVIISG